MSTIEMKKTVLEALEADFNALVNSANTTKAIILKSFSEQKEDISNKLSVIADSEDNADITDFDGEKDVVIGNTADRWSAFCAYGIRHNWAFAVNRTLLCGKRDGTVKGVGMTEAQYSALSDKLTALSACLLDYISADMAWKNRAANISKEREKALLKLITDCENKCFLLYKSIKAVFKLSPKCTKWDISTLAYLTITVKYRDRNNISAGWTFGQCSTMTLLNKVLRLDSVVSAESERLKVLRASKSPDKVNKAMTEAIAEAKAEITE